MEVDTQCPVVAYLSSIHHLMEVLVFHTACYGIQLQQYNFSGCSTVCPGTCSDAHNFSMSSQDHAGKESKNMPNWTRNASCVGFVSTCTIVFLFFVCLFFNIYHGINGQESTSQFLSTAVPVQK